MTTKLMGTVVQRVEDERMLRGRGRYVDDLGAGALHAAVLRSPHAHARVTNVDVDAVLDLEGVHAVWTHDDLTGAMAEPLPLLIPHPALTHGRTQYALAKDEVNYVGEAIALVVADDRYVAEDALDRIRVDYELLPPVIGVEAARAAEALVHEDVPGNVGARLEQENGDARAAIAAFASPTFCSRRAPTLPGTSSWTSRSAARAALMPTTGGRTSYSTRMASTASSAT